MHDSQDTLTQQHCQIDHPDCTTCSAGERGSAKTTVWRLISGAVLLVLPWIFSFPFVAALLIWLAAWLITGGDVLLAALRQIRQGQWFDEHFLMTLATIGAFATGEYPEAVAVMLFYQTGELLQDLAVDRSRRSVRALLAIKPDRALRLNGQVTQEVAPGDMKVGEKMLIRPGDRVALDSRVLQGRSDLNTAALTGESSLLPAAPGDELRAGYINGGGMIVATVLRTEAESSVSRILRLVEEAAARKAPAERFMTRFARIYTPVMVGLALLVALLPPLILRQSLSEWVYRAMILLVISCPCALVLSIPLSYFAGIGGASARGILVKGGQYLDRLALVKSMAWDKTGTMTSGSYLVRRILARDSGGERDVLQWAALAEHGSDHPLARSIQKAWRQASGDPPDASLIRSVENLPGLGLAAEIDGHRLLLGNAQLLAENGVLASPAVLAVQADSPAQPVLSGNVVHLAIDGVYSGLIELADELRPEAAQTIRRLRELGIQTHVLLSGDRPEHVADIAARAGFDHYKGGLLPEQKVAELETLTASGQLYRPVAFVGDGVNDTPVLASADLSVALGSSSDAALESADIVISGDDLTKLPEAVQLAKKTGRIVRQNIVIALGLKVLVVLLAVLGFGGIWQAVFADVGVALIAVLNALRILKR